MTELDYHTGINTRNHFKMIIWAQAIYVPGKNHDAYTKNV